MQRGVKRDQGNQIGILNFSLFPSPVVGSPRLPLPNLSLDVLFEKFDIPAIGLIGDIDEVAGDRNHAGRHIESDIGDHPPQCPSRDAQPGRLDDEISRQKPRRDISPARDKTDNGIPTEPKLGAGNGKGVVK